MSTDHATMTTTDVQMAIADRDATIAKLMAEIDALRDRIDRESTDDLTGLHNRRWLRQFWNRLTTPADVVEAIAYLDVDGLKPINDRYGHKIGDRAITHVASAIMSSGCYGVRLGGDEFLVLVPRGWDAATIMNQIMDHIKRHPIGAPDGGLLSVDVSCGVRIVSGSDLSTMMDDADRAMYAIKRERSGGCLIVQ